MGVGTRSVMICSKSVINSTQELVSHYVISVYRVYCVVTLIRFFDDP